MPTKALPAWDILLEFSRFLTESEKNERHGGAWMLRTVMLLIVSNVFMTYAWYGHLKALENRPLYVAILVSWGVAFFEYCFQVPANRIGFQYFSLAQLKIIQEVITLVIFVLFASFYMKEKPSLNYLWAGICLLGAVYFIFRDGASHQP